MSRIRAHNRNRLEQCGDAAAWAVGIVRWSLHGSQSCSPAPRSLPAFLADLATVGALFRTAHETMLGLQGAGLVVALPGTVAVTRHERRLLRAAAAAQEEDDAVADNYLFKLAPHPQARPPLAHAVTELATSLATSGHWLSAFPLPAPALRVAHLHGIDLGAIRVAWAHPAGGSHAPPLARPIRS